MGGHRLGNAVIRLLERGEVGRKEPAVCNVAENELAAQRLNAPVVGEPAGDGPSFVVVVNGDRRSAQPTQREPEVAQHPFLMPDA